MLLFTFFSVCVHCPYSAGNTSCHICATHIHLQLLISISPVAFADVKEQLKVDLAKVVKVEDEQVDGREDERGRGGL